jgi:excinuclease ABC subunit B
MPSVTALFRHAGRYMAAALARELRAVRRRPPSAPGPPLVSKAVPEFAVNPAYLPVADQPTARDGLVEGLNTQDRFQTLLGVTGSGKTATMAFAIERVQRPALVIAHNKTLAAQLCNEFREFFPQNAVEYFVSYYDYYQPEAYVPSQDLYIEKDSSINQEIERLRHSATASLFGRRDVIVVASVSCIFGLGSPEKYDRLMLMLKRGEMTDRDGVLRKLVDIQYSRNDAALGRGSFRVRGETLEVFPAYAETAFRAVFFGDEVETLQEFDPLTGEVLKELNYAAVWPATHYATDRQTIERAVGEIRDELEARCKELEEQGKLLESHRLRQRTQFDMEMLRELGFCNGIENYSRILDGREPGARPYCLLDFFPDDFVCFIDESHQTVPQIGGMYEGDRSRKQTLVDYGFRLPSALDNRPQTFDEFLERTRQIVFVSATPGDFERNHSSRVVEQIVRPTGIVDPAVDVRETRNQIDDLMEEIRRRVEAQERTLVTTLTKKMSEDLTDYLLEYGFRVRYLHSEVDTLERIQIIRELRLGEFDILVGVNLLREGLDLPEVSLVAILDADKEGFLRGETSLIQTIGRAARNVRGTVIMYADKETAAMRSAIDETNRRRAIQVTYNERHGITPATIQKGISDISDFLMMESKVPTSRGRRRQRETEGMSAEEIRRTMVELEEEMLAAADDLRFEYAAKLRDEIKALRRELAEAETGA